MTHWEIVTVIIALVGLVSAITAPFLKLQSTIAALRTSVSVLETRLAALSREQERLRADLRETDKRLTARELRPQRRSG